jgi:tRNA G37 N-methylase Trm5
MEEQQAWGYYAPRGLKALSLSLQSKILSRRMHKRLLRWKLLPSVYDISRFDLKLRCHVADNTTERNLVFDQGVMAEMERVLQALKMDDTFIDLGANCGIFSLTASKVVGSGGRVLAVEANPDMIKRLRFNIEANDLDNVSVIEAAVGDSTQERTRAEQTYQENRRALDPGAGEAPHRHLCRIRDCKHQCD